MNYIEVIGGTKKQRTLAEDVAFWCIEKMMPRMKTLEIEIQLSKLEEGRYGFCMEQDRNREFHLEISKDCDRDEFITSICHEMVHVKQYARNEFSIREDSGGKNYWELPYEIEAYELQETLLKEYKDKI